MHPQCSASALGQNLEISAGLRGFYYAESKFLSRHGQFHGIVAGDLQEYPRVRAAFVGLPRRMQETRAEAKNGGNAFLVAHGVADRLERLLMLGVHLDVAEDGEVVAGFDARQMRLEIPGERV